MLRMFFRRIRPGQLIVLVFLGIILLGAGLLCLPAAARSGRPTPFLTSLFTATSATCVTGLIRVDTGTHWTMFGQVVILLLIQVGGLGFMTIACLFFFALRRRIGGSMRPEPFLELREAGAASGALKDAAGVVLAENVSIRKLYEPPAGYETEFSVGGRPVVVSRRAGKGKLWMLLFTPVPETAEGRSGDAAAGDAVYRALPAKLGVSPHWESRDPVEARLYRAPDGTLLVSAMRHDRLAETADGGVYPADAPGGECYAVVPADPADLSRAKVTKILESYNKAAVITPDPGAAFGAFAAEFALIEAAGGVVVNDCGQWLMIRRNGRWDLPKGHLECGERIEECAAREIEEETGVRASVVRPLCDTLHAASCARLVPQAEEGIEQVVLCTPAEVTRNLRDAFPTIRCVVAAMGK